MLQAATTTNVGKTVRFQWSGAEHTGTIIEQIKSNAILGQKTVVQTDISCFTFYGKFDVGDNGPFKVLEIK